MTSYKIRLTAYSSPTWIEDCARGGILITQDINRAGNYRKATAIQRMADRGIIEYKLELHTPDWAIAKSIDLSYALLFKLQGIYPEQTVALTFIRYSATRVAFEFRVDGVTVPYNFGYSFEVLKCNPISELTDLRIFRNI